MLILITQGICLVSIYKSKAVTWGMISGSGRSRVNLLRLLQMVVVG